MNKKAMILKYDKLPDQSFDGKYRNIDTQLLKYITNRVRHTYEYKMIIQYMKKTMNISKCSFYEDYSMDNGFTIELHHAPLTLFDIVEIVANKQLSRCENKKDPYIEPWAVEEEVALLHFRLEVGLVPLNPTAHALVHNDSLKLHPKMIEGNWRRFISDYSDFISDDIASKIEKFNDLESKDPDKIPEILKYKPAIIINSNFKLLTGERLEKMIMTRLKDKYENMKKLS